MSRWALFINCVTDAHSKWIEAVRVPSMTTINVLRRLFSTHEIRTQIISDNGTGFASVQLKTFLKRNGIRQTLVPRTIRLQTG